MIEPSLSLGKTRLHGKTALVTGASGGIGTAIVERFRAEGARVLTCDITGEPDFLVDVADEAQVCGLFNQLSDLDILVNNAGIQIQTPSHELSMADFDRVVNINLRGTVLCCREALKLFLRSGRGGVIVNNSSCAQTIPKPEFLSYAISKGALDNLCKTLALEYAGRGIRVNNVGPGAVLTPMNAAWKDDPQLRASVETHIPLGRAATADEMAAVFAFLASPEAAYITGQTLYACGGVTLYADFRENWSS
ncbi:MAG: SDR family oxidoreductase [Acidobacteria bacterium]|nr:SDR family oxidoreductase [Acidobacteriota bacterium]